MSAALRVSPVVFGRDNLLELARGRLSQVRTGVGGLLFLAGEAGIGKSRLVREIVHEADERGIRVVRAAVFPGDVDLSGGLLLDLAHELGRSRRPADAESRWRSPRRSPPAHPVRGMRTVGAGCWCWNWSTWSRAWQRRIRRCSPSRICIGPTTSRSSCCRILRAAFPNCLCWSWAPIAATSCSRGCRCGSGDLGCWRSDWLRRYGCLGSACTRSGR